MTTIAATHYFDILDYVRKAKEIKDPEALAEYQVKQIEAVVDQVIQQVTQQTKEEVNCLREEIANKELATKYDIELVKYDIELVKKDLELAKLELKKDIEMAKEETNSKIAQLKYDTIKFVVWTGIGVVAFLGSMLARGFHWI